MVVILFNKDTCILLALCYFMYICYCMKLLQNKGDHLHLGCTVGDNSNCWAYSTRAHGGFVFGSGADCKFCIAKQRDLWNKWSLWWTWMLGECVWNRSAVFSSCNSNALQPATSHPPCFHWAWRVIQEQTTSRNTTIKVFNFELRVRLDQLRNAIGLRVMHVYCVCSLC